VNAVSFSFDGTLLATATTEPDSVVRVWSLVAAEPEQIFTFHDQSTVINAIVFNPTQSRLAIASSSRPTVIVDPITQVVDRQPPDTVSTAMAYSADGKLLMVPRASPPKCSIPPSVASHVCRRSGVRP
jgi:WD40 repeat protein